MTEAAYVGLICDSMLHDQVREPGCIHARRANVGDAPELAWCLLYRRSGFWVVRRQQGCKPGRKAGLMGGVV